MAEVIWRIRRTKLNKHSYTQPSLPGSKVDSAENIKVSSLWAFDEILHEKADRIRKQVDETISETKAQIQIQFKNGDPAKEICKFARKGNYDLIIMGSRGLGAMAELTIGSVSHKVIRHSAELVLIVK